MQPLKSKIIPRDISWLSFNARVLQEAADPSVPLRERIRFLGIFSNNLDEFFRVRVASLRRMMELGNKSKLNMHFEINPDKILESIQLNVLHQQNEFTRIWNGILSELKQEKVFLVDEKQLNKDQQIYVKALFEHEIRNNVIPLMIESLPELPYLRDKSIYLAVVMSLTGSAYKQKLALIEIPSKALGRFFILPSKPGEHHIILLEDIIRFNLPTIFSYFGYNVFESHIFKVTKDADFDIDNDSMSTSFVQKIEKGLKSRRKGKTVRFVYDKEMNPGILEFLVQKLKLTRRDNFIPGGRIHNFRHFMDFPKDVFEQKAKRNLPFVHPLLENQLRVTDVIVKQDLLLTFPYHSFSAVIDLLREAAIDPAVLEIKITAYRLASKSTIINALINAVRNGKKVTVILELRARFDEEANLYWKERLEEEGVKVLVGITNMKVHAKMCLIKKRINNKTIQYGFISTGNLNENTARVYSDFCLFTANRNIMADINRIFSGIEKPKPGLEQLKTCKTLINCPFALRKELEKLIQREIKLAQAGKKASILLKVNSLSDEKLIIQLDEAAKAGVTVQLIIRGICCMTLQNKKYKTPIKAISIIDEYLEHARVFVFHNGGKEKVYISSADLMVRNLDHRVEVTCPVLNGQIKKEIKKILEIQLADDVKARWLNNQATNEYVVSDNKKKTRSQVEIYNYLKSKIY